MGLISKDHTFVNGVSNLIDADQVNADFDEIYALVNGQLDDANVKSAAAIALSKLHDGTLGTLLGITEGATKRRGKAVAAGEISTTSTSYVVADQVTGIVLPTDGLLRISYTAETKIAVASGKVGVFVDGNQIRTHDNAVVEASPNGTGYSIIVTAFAASNGLDIGSLSPVAKPVMFEELCVEEVAGTHTISVQYRSTGGGGTTYLKDRKLRVKAEGYG